MDSDETEPVEPDIDDLDATEAADQRVQDLADDRAWVDSCLTGVTTVAAALADCPNGVQSALESLLITICARAKRALRSDLGRKA